MSAFDPEMAKKSIAPGLSDEDRLAYVKAEQKFIEELLEDATDSKWVYQALMECALIEARLIKGLTSGSKANIKEWLQKLKELDPLRSGRWADTEALLLKDTSGT